jgi:hypothetical protein
MRGLLLFFLNLILSAVMSFSATAYPLLPPSHCRDLLIFEAPEQKNYFTKISNSLRWLETDRNVAYARHAEQSVHDFIQFILRTQEMQIRAISTEPPSTLDKKILEHYRQIIASHLHTNQRTFDELVEKYPNLKEMKVKTLHEENLDLSDLIVTMMIRTNSFIAEFLSVLRFPDVLKTETEVGKIVNKEEFPQDEASQALLSSVSVRQMDFVSQVGSEIVWAEVKYLGRYKEYSQATGNDVLDKMIKAKQVTDLLDKPHRVVLIIVGPGRLTQEAYEAYIQNGIEVIYMTPGWSAPPEPLVQHFKSNTLLHSA